MPPYFLQHYSEFSSEAKQLSKQWLTQLILYGGMSHFCRWFVGRVTMRTIQERKTKIIMIHFDILTLFPDMLSAYFEDSILKRAQENQLIQIGLHNIRDYTTDKHHIVDDTPFGGGGGMVMKPDPLFRAIESVRADNTHVIFFSPQGRVFNQSIAQELSQRGNLLLVCGRYEGVDERVRETLIDEELSIGDYVLTGGELPAMVLVDAVSRLIPGVLGAEHGAAQDSHATGLLEHPHYTRPANFRGMEVPDVLLSGHHANIDQWRRQESLRRTWQRRPDMLERAALSKADKKFLVQLKQQAPPAEDADG